MTALLEMELYLCRVKCDEIELERHRESQVGKDLILKLLAESF